MQLALRPYVTAGVAIVGASVIAATPITQAAPQIQHRAVELTASVQNLDVSNPFGAPPSAAAFVNSLAAVPSLVPTALLDGMAVGDALGPITAWAEVLTLAFKNVSLLAQGGAEAWLGLGQQVGSNWLGYGDTVITALQGAGEGFADWATTNLPTALQLMVDAVASGDVFDVPRIVWSAVEQLVVAAGMPLFSLTSIPVDIVQNLANVTDAVLSSQLMTLSLSVMQTIRGTTAEIDRAGGLVTDALADGDPLAAFSALLNMPAAVTGAFLNGSTIPGLLKFPDGPFSVPGFAWRVLIALPNAIARAITPPATAGLFGLAAEEDAPAAQAALPEANQVPATDETAESLSLSTDPETVPANGTGDVAETPEVNPEIPPAAPVEDTQGETEDTTAPEDSEDTEGSESPDGSTDLSDGNKAEPGDTATDPGNDDGPDSDSSDESGDLSDGNKAEPGNTGSGSAGGSDADTGSTTGAGAANGSGGTSGGDSAGGSDSSDN